ncbi:hypothetical protein [Pontibacillus yanchengensis]|uniref:Uncharacterized protein n=1 Tax=Pontibacillus yanchengensis Y32 TaxID=1385514 RepID=A0A0A2TAG2_9BACI|nr:hypothetical protein [Pontibacillus yanchengensis]KGP72807.1 hypothetical protein N782_10595 [Pontibacillus yanchengensis Y32]
MNRTFMYLILVVMVLCISAWFSSNVFSLNETNSSKSNSNALKEAEQKIQSLQKQINNLKKENHSIKLEIPEEKAFFQNNVISRNNLSIEQLKDILGEPKSIEEYDSIKGTQYDFHYREASFTFEKSKNQTWLKSFSFTQPIIMTQHGITVGDTTQNVVKAYGNQYRIEKDAMIYGGKSNTILFIIRDDQVKRIQIRYDYE